MAFQTPEERKKEDLIRERDIAVLESLATCGRLSEVEEGAFSDMLERLRKGSSVFWTLSDTQRAWAEEVYGKLELDGADEPTPLTELQRQRAKALGPMNLDAAGPKVMSPPRRKVEED